MRINMPVTDEEYVLPPGEVIVTRTDLQGNITYANEAFLRSSGFSRAEVLGAPQNIVRHPDMPPAAFADLWTTIRAGRPWTAVVKNRRKSGGFYWVVANVSPIVADGAIAGYLSVRTRPEIAQVRAATRLYADLSKGRAKVTLRGGRVMSTGMRGRLFEAVLSLSFSTRVWLAMAPAAVLQALALAVLWAYMPEGVEHTHWLLALLGSATGFLALLIAIPYLIVGVGRPIEAVTRSAERVLGGDIDRSFPQSGDPEIGRLAALLNQMNAKLVGVLRDTVTSVGVIRGATSDVAQGNEDLSRRTEQQAASLEETASSMEELTATVRQNAENARAANQLTAEVAEVATRGGGVMGEAVSAMAGIGGASSRIAAITGVIDGIAFQTNILALNAAVEAARAGEQGRGFAVVASEVRGLAQRSAEAAREIKGLIEDSNGRVRRGQVQVELGAQAMREVVDAIGRMNALMGEIAAASKEQSTGIEQVNLAVTGIDEMTQQNAALVEQAAAAAESLKEQADTLAAAVSVFNFDLVQGNPPGPSRARAAVLRAVAPVPRVRVLPSAQNAARRKVANGRRG